MEEKTSDIFWFTPNKQLKLLIIIMFVCIVLSITCLALIFLRSDKTITKSDIELFIFSSVFMITLGLLAAQIFRAMISKKLGIKGRLLLIEDKQKNIAIKPYHEAWNVAQRGILIDDMFFNLGNPEKILSIDKNEFNSKLVPILNNIKTMNEWGYFKYRLANMNKESTLFSALFLFIIVLSLYGYFALELKAN